MHAHQPVEDQFWLIKRIKTSELPGQTGMSAMLSFRDYFLLVLLAYFIVRRIKERIFKGANGWNNDSDNNFRHSIISSGNPAPT